MSYPAYARPGPGPGHEKRRPAPAPWRVESAGRAVYAIGDLHGDWDKTVEALQLAGAIAPGRHNLNKIDCNASNASIAWAGGDRIVVKLGDVLDRGDSELAITNLLDCLAGQAEAAGGKLIRILGNHELMNAMGEVGYATRGRTEQYGGPAARLAAFAPGGPEALRLAELNVVQMVDDTLFVYASPDAIAGLNTATQAWLHGEAPRLRRGLTHGDGPLWTREYWEHAAGQRRRRGQRGGGLRFARRRAVGHSGRAPESLPPAGDAALPRPARQRRPGGIRPGERGVRGAEQLPEPQGRTGQERGGPDGGGPHGHAGRQGRVDVRRPALGNRRRHVGRDDGQPRGRAAAGRRRQLFGRRAAAGWAASLRAHAALCVTQRSLIALSGHDRTALMYASTSTLGAACACLVCDVHAFKKKDGNCSPPMIDASLDFNRHTHARAGQRVTPETYCSLRHDCTGAPPRPNATL